MSAGTTQWRPACLRNWVNLGRPHGAEDPGWMGEVGLRSHPVPFGDPPTEAGVPLMRGRTQGRIAGLFVDPGVECQAAAPSLHGYLTGFHFPHSQAVGCF